MKFQNPIVNFEWPVRRKDERTDKPKAICPFNFFKVGGIKNKFVVYYVMTKMGAKSLHNSS